MSPAEIPLFPLNAVLFPGGPLPLRIFEPRYLDMVSHCIRTDSGFGVCLISEGKEVGEAATTHELGTLAKITDWDRRPDGLLGITAVGQQRFRVQSVRVQPDKLAMAKVELLPPAESMALPERHLKMAEMLGRLLEQVGDLYANVERHFGEANWVSYRLAELMPVPMETRQHLLEMDDPVKRLGLLSGLLDGLDVY